MLKMIGVLGVAFATLALSQPAYSQQGGTRARVGVVASSSKRVQGLRITQLRQSLKDLGYVDGRNIVLDIGFGNGKRSAIKVSRETKRQLPPSTNSVGAGT